MEENSESFNDINLLMSLSGYTWDQFSDDDDYSSGMAYDSSSVTPQNPYTYGALSSQSNGQQFMTEEYITPNYTIAQDGSVYTCLS